MSETKIVTGKVYKVELEEGETQETYARKICAEGGIPPEMFKDDPVSTLLEEYYDTYFQVEGELYYTYGAKYLDPNGFKMFGPTADGGIVFTIGYNTGDSTLTKTLTKIIDGINKNNERIRVSEGSQD